MFSKIAGVSHKNSDGTSRQKILERMREEGYEGDRLYLELEPNNPYDPNAIKVLNRDFEQIGYINSDLAFDLNKWLKAGENIEVKISEITGGEEGKRTIGCNIEIILPNKHGGEEKLPTGISTGATQKDLTDETTQVYGYIIIIALIILTIVFAVIISDKKANKANDDNKKYVALDLSDEKKIERALVLSSDKRIEEKAAEQERLARQKKAAERKKAEAYELNELRKKMTSKIDEVEGIKWIYEKTTRRAIDRRSSKKNFFYVYLGQNASLRTMWPRIYIGFMQNSWVFFNKIIMNIDGERRELSFNHFEVKRDVLGANAILEYIDLHAEKYEMLIKSISKSKKTIVRFEGPQYYYDFTMTKEQKNALGNIWRLYELMK